MKWIEKIRISTNAI